MRRTLGLLFSVLAFWGTAFAEDPLAVSPKLYKKLFENERVRVMEVTFAPGDEVKKHSHPDHFVTVLEAGELTISKPDGSSQKMELAPDQVIWIPAETHWAENTGKTRVKLLVAEQKNKTDRHSKLQATPP